MAAQEEAEMEDAAAVVDEYREIVVEGSFQDALETCRRLMRTESNAQRVETAHLVLDRLRSTKDDSDDNVNALLRLLSNYVAPTRELTEDALSLLFFCDRRVLLIHHLSKLTYQSKECVKLVVEAYLELLSSDRSLLVPILGSLADLPLDTTEKSAVLDAAESLLDAAAEEDVPAVVQSLLSMVTVSTAPRIAVKLRAECNRVSSGTLCLILEVIGRFAVAGSVVLNAFLNTIRYTEALTQFDIILLTYLMGRSTENEIAIKTSTFIAHRGRFRHSVMRKTLECLVQQEWHSVLPSTIRLCSFLLAACFQDLTGKKLALELIQIGVDCLGFLVESRSSVHEEALTLLFTLSSQPKKLLMLATSSVAQQKRGFLCWKVAEAVAARLSTLATHRSKVLVPYAHLFLDHLHSIASSTNDSNDGDSDFGGYPSNVIDLLCSTMVTLTQQERGVFPLLMITIQKQLVSRIGISGIGQGHQALNIRAQSSSSHRASAGQVKQLMALFLAGHLLKSKIALEERDRKSLVNWILRLLSTAASDEILLHALRLVREGMTGSIAPFMKGLASEEEHSLCSSLVTQIFRKRGLIWSDRDEVLTRQTGTRDSVIAYELPSSSSKDAATPSSLVVDLSEFTRKMQFGVNPLETKGSIDEDQAIEREYLLKLSLLREIFTSFIAFSPSKLQERILGGGFVFPSQYRHIIASDVDATSLDARELCELIWCLACALDIKVAGVNRIAKQCCDSNQDKLKLARDHKRLSSCLKICLELHGELQKLIVVQKGLLEVWQDKAQKCESADGNAHNVQGSDIQWLRVQAVIVERFMGDQVEHDGGELACATLYGIDLEAVCAYFEILWKSSSEKSLSLAHELELLRLMSYHLNSEEAVDVSILADNPSVDQKESCREVAQHSKYMLLDTAGGRRTIKYMIARARELGILVNSSTEYGESDEDDQIDSSGEDLSESAMRELATWNLQCIYKIFIQLFEFCNDSKAMNEGAVWSEKMMQLFAASCSCETDLSDTNTVAHQDQIYRFLLDECLKMKDPRLACALVDILITLTAKTRKQRAMSHLCVLLLRQPFPNSGSAAVALVMRGLNSFKVPGEALPVSLLPPAVVSLRGGSQCSLTTYRCSSLKWRHLVYLAVGSWAFCSSATAASMLLASYLDTMKDLVESVAPRENEKQSKAGEFEGNESDDGTRQLPAVVHGEHWLLTSLTIETFPFFLDSVLLCGVAALFRASPNRKVENSSRGANPFDDICNSLVVIHNAMNLYVDAENSGFNLPAKTNLLVLHSASYILKSIKNRVQKCISWRAEQSADDDRGALRHLEVLFHRVRLVLSAMERVLESFQERVVVKMHQKAHLIPSAADVTSTKKQLGAGRWKNELLAKTLLPYFAHAIEELKDFVDHESDVNNIDAVEDADSSTWTRLKSSTSGGSDSDRFVKARSFIDLELRSSSLSDWDPDADVNWDNEDENSDEIGIDEEGEMDDEDDMSSDRDEVVKVITVLTPRKARPKDKKRPETHLANEGLRVVSLPTSHKKQKRTKRA
ncbi:hypothetical protein FI667_g15690, partial [Globisporangium splendens]